MYTEQITLFDIIPYIDYEADNLSEHIADLIMDKNDLLEMVETLEQHAYNVYRLGGNIDAIRYTIDDCMMQIDALENEISLAFVSDDDVSWFYSDIDGQPPEFWTMGH